MARKIPLLGTALAALTAIGGTGLVPSASAEAQTAPQPPRNLFSDVNANDPVLWRGVLRNAAGVPSPGYVTSYMQTSAGDMDTKTDPQIPLVEVKVDSTGTFEIRSAYKPEFDALVDQMGNLTVMITATTTTGDFNIGEASVKWVDGAWAPASSAEAAAPNGKITRALMAEQAMDQGVNFDVNAEMSNPETRAMAGEWDNIGPEGGYPGQHCEYIQPGGRASFGALGAPYHPWLPDAAQVVGIGRFANGAGFMKLDTSYKQSRTTSSSVTVGMKGGWYNGSGTTAIQSSDGLEAGGVANGSVNNGVVMKWAINTSRRVSKFLCASNMISNPAWNGAPLGGAHVVTVVNPHAWAGGGHWGLPAQPIPLQADLCDAVSPNGGTLQRSSGSALDISASWSVTAPDIALGTHFGAANVSMSGTSGVATSTDVTYKWTNNLPAHNKFVCGDKAHPTMGRTDAIVAYKIL